MALTWDEQMWYAAEQRGEQRGELRGELRAGRRILVEYWEVCFGPVPDEVKTKIERLEDIDKLRQLRLSLYRAQTLEEAQSSLAG